MRYSLSLQLGTLLKDKGLKLAVAESCTGGSFAQAITTVPGSSAWFECSAVMYSEFSKTKILAVPSDMLEQCGPVSRDVACAMLRGLFIITQADIGASITGFAGPEAGEAWEPKVGTVWMAFGTPVRSEVHKVIFEGGRYAVIDNTVLYLLQQLIRIVSA